MRYWLSLGLLAFSVGVYAGQQQDPEHPWPDHEPPPDYVCVPALDEHQVKTNIHACSCLGMGLKKECHATEEEDDAQRNSSRCKSWCKLKQCSCASQCRDSKNGGHTHAN